MRIALVHKSLADTTMGGVARLYRELATAYRGLGHEVVTVSSFPCAWSVRHTVLTADPGSPARYNQAVDEALARMDVNVAECSTWEFELGDYVNRPRRRRALVAVRCEMSCQEIGALELVAGERELLRRADVRVAVSRYARSSLRRAYPEVQVDGVVHNGVDRRRFHSGMAGSLAELCSRYLVDVAHDGNVTRAAALSPARRARLGAALDEFCGAHGPVVLWVGKITPMKGWRRLEAIVRALEPSTRFVVLLGHAPAFHSVTIRAGRSLAFLRDVAEQELASLYGAADFLLSTSTVEGFGLAIAEAAATGIPVLLPTGLTAPGELLPDGQGAYRYVSIGDLARLLGDPSVAERRVPPTFPSWEEAATASLRLYAEAGTQVGQP